MKLPLPDQYKNRLRPVYHAALNALSPKGKVITMNGTDSFRIDAAHRTFSQEHEPDVWHRLMDAVNPGDTCVDIGASVGLYTLGFATRLNGRGQVFSFEPDSASFHVLQRRVVLNGFESIVCALNCAVGDANGVVKFVGGLGPTSHLAGVADGAVYSVACVRLDTIFSAMGMVPDVLKIDVEGFELEVVKGAAGLLCQPKRPRLVYVDVHPWAWPKLGLETTENALHEVFREMGYAVERRSCEYADIFAFPAP